MKKLLTMVLMAIAISFSVNAQNKEKTEVKPTSTVGQKVHNTFSKKKHHKGYKVKHKHANGSKHVKKVNTTTGAVKTTDKKD